MANTWNLTVNVTTPNINKVKITRVSEIDEDAKRMVIEAQVIASGALIYPTPVDGDVFRLEVTQTEVDGLAAPPAPSRTNQALIAIRITGQVTAFDTLLAAYRAAGTDKRGNLLTAMAAVSGVVRGGPLDTQTKPMIAAGTLT
jgi:hypothetical protein